MKIEFKVFYKGKTYSLSSGLDAYSFHVGVNNEIDKKYGLNALLKYVDLIRDSYIGDDNKTPLGELTDFVADKWLDLKNSDGREVLDEFYGSMF